MAIRHLTFLMLETHEPAVAEPNFASDEAFTFEFTPNDNPMDGFYGDSESDFEAYCRRVATARSTH